VSRVGQENLGMTLNEGAYAVKKILLGHESRYRYDFVKTGGKESS
jgi:hypothetical protein